MRKINKKNLCLAGQESEILIRKKVILYNMKREILVYKYRNDLGLPYVDVRKEDDFLNDIKNYLGIKLYPEKIEDIISIIYYEKFFTSQNGKLNCRYKKIVNDYYSYYIEFENDVIKNLIDSSIKNFKYENIDLISIDDFMNLKISDTDKQVAIKKLQAKLDYREF